MPSIFELQDLFYEDRPSMDEANQNIDYLLFRLREEILELENAPTNHLGKEKHQAQEFVDIVLFCMAGLRALGFDAEAEIKEKIAKNSLKYEPKYFQRGIPFSTGIRVSREQAAQNGLDEEFYASA